MVIWSCKKSQMHPLRKDKAFNVNVLRENLQTTSPPAIHSINWTPEWICWNSLQARCPLKLLLLKTLISHSLAKTKVTGHYLHLDLDSSLVYIACILKGLLMSSYVPSMLLSFPKHGLRLKNLHVQINMQEITRVNKSHLII